MLYLTKGEDITGQCDCNTGFSYVDCDCKLYASKTIRNTCCVVDDASNEMFYYEEIVVNGKTFEVNRITDQAKIEELKIILMGFFII